MSSESKLWPCPVKAAKLSSNSSCELQLLRLPVHITAGVVEVIAIAGLCPWRSR